MNWYVPSVAEIASVAISQHFTSVMYALAMLAFLGLSCLSRRIPKWHLTSQFVFLPLYVLGIENTVSFCRAFTNCDSSGGGTLPLCSSFPHAVAAHICLLLVLSLCIASSYLAFRQGLLKGTQWTDVPLSALPAMLSVSLIWLAIYLLHEFSLYLRHVAG